MTRTGLAVPESESGHSDETAFFPSVGPSSSIFELGDLTDRQLLSLPEGDLTHASFGLILERHGQPVFRCAKKYTDSVWDAQDLTQETFLTIWTRRAEIRISGSSALPWLLVVCRNHAMNLARKRSRHRPLNWEQVSTKHEARVTMPAELKDGLLLLLMEVERLPAAQRVLIQLCIVDGYSYQEAATMTGSTLATVGKNLSQARRSIRRAFSFLDASSTQFPPS